MPKRSIIFPRGMVRAAGAVVWRFAPGIEPIEPGQAISPAEIEVLLVHRPRYRDWSWPKGKAEKNEPLPVAAVREVEEETGQVVSLGAPLTTQRYRLGSGHLKEVYYWAAHVIGRSPGRSTRQPVMRASKKEIDVVQWVSPPQARQMLTRRGDRRLLTELVGRAARGELQTSTLVLLRHAKAVKRSKWQGTEPERPLTRVGVAEAIDLIPILSAFGVAKAVSSPWRRCKQTVRPYVTLGSAHFRTEQVLAEDSVELDAKASSKLVRKIIRGPRAATVVCLHRPGQEALVAPLRAVSSRRVAAAMEQPKPELEPGEMLVAHISLAGSPRVLEVERHHPLTRLSLK